MNIRLSKKRLHQQLMTNMADMADTYYEDYVWDNNDKVSAETVMYNEGVYGFPLAINSDYFMHYDSSIITGPTSIEKIQMDSSSSFVNGYSSSDKVEDAAVIIGGVWDDFIAEEQFGNNYKTCKLPEFTGTDEKNTR